MASVGTRPLIVDPKVDGFARASVARRPLKATVRLEGAAWSTSTVAPAARASVPVPFKVPAIIRESATVSTPSSFSVRVAPAAIVPAPTRLNRAASPISRVPKSVKAVAALQLFGNYAGKTFTTASDGKGGTSIEVSGGGGTARPPAPLPVVHTFIAAAARIGSSDGARLALTHASPHDERLTLATPRTSAF